jgi:hypothetical protein
MILFHVSWPVVQFMMYVILQTYKNTELTCQGCSAIFLWVVLRELQQLNHTQCRMVGCLVKNGLERISTETVMFYSRCCFEHLLEETEMNQNNISWRQPRFKPCTSQIQEHSIPILQPAWCALLHRMTGKKTILLTDSYSFNTEKFRP